MTDTTVLWINVGLLCCLAVFGALLARAIRHLVSLRGEKLPLWELVRLPNGTVLVHHNHGTTQFNGVRVENSKIAALLLEAATLDDAKETNS